ncbi:nodulin-related protein 1 [Canna indica]|uniref:Nodulin-related protein 1 n=1 Tax=Canna indica TaxID=4628 RepID=A0AAQ3Q398_9LILI|nr:nodulin-related protein 1 [Canna indica]
MDSQHTAKPSSESHKAKPNTTQLMSSAKIVAEAAKSTFRHDSNKVDKAKVAGAGADLLGAASHYAKLEEKSLGKYVEQAENYLHKYQSSQTTTSHSSMEGKVGSSSTTHTNSAAHAEGGFGDYLKLAGGFLKKR